MRIHWHSGTFSAADMNGMGRRIDVLEAILAARERELLELKGPCSNNRCRLHYAHSGPCDTSKKESNA